MIRGEELADILDAVSHLLCDELRADLRSDFQKRNAETVAMALNRIVNQLRTGDALAAQHAADWRTLDMDFRTLTGTPPPVVDSGTAPLPALMNITGNMQDVLADPAHHEALLAALRRDDRGAVAWLQSTGSALVDFLETNEKSYQAPVPRESNSETGDTPEALQQKLGNYLARRFPDLPAHAVTNLRIIPGGYVKQTAIFDLPPNAALPTTVVMRRDLPASITGTSVVDEYSIVERAHAIGLPVPKPLLLESDATPLGGAFMLMTEIEAATTAGPPFARERALSPEVRGPDFGRELAALLARLHSKTTTAPPENNAAFEQHMQKVRAQHAAWQAMKKPPLSLGVDLGFAYLFSRPALENRPHCLVHGDIGTHNLLVRDVRIAALLDWELAHEGDPAEDIAQCRMVVLEDVMPWPEFVAAYVDAGGDPRACAADAVAHFCVATMVKHSFQFAVGRNYFFGGERRDALAMAIVTQWTERLLQYSARALKIASDLAASDGQLLTDPFFIGPAKARD